jgi:hypothetical protein
VCCQVGPAGRTGEVQDVEEPKTRFGRKGHVIKRLAWGSHADCKVGGLPCPNAQTPTVRSAADRAEGAELLQMQPVRWTRCT